MVQNIKKKPLAWKKDVALFRYFSTTGLADFNEIFHPAGALENFLCRVNVYKDLGDFYDGPIAGRKKNNFCSAAITSLRVGVFPLKTQNQTACLKVEITQNG